MQAASGRRFLLVALVVSALSLASGEQEAQAQLFIDVYPNQDNPTRPCCLLPLGGRIGT